MRDTRIAMPDAKVELVQRSWDASLAADWPAVLATLHPEAEIRDFDVPDNRFEDGQIVYMAYYNDQEEAFEALRRAA